VHERGGLRTADHCSRTFVTSTEDYGRYWYERFHRKCYTTSGPSHLRDTIVESDLLFDSAPDPWIGYARNKAENRLEWISLGQGMKTHTECINELTPCQLDVRKPVNVGDGRLDAERPAADSTVRPTRAAVGLSGL
jgi:hypothetical protein